MRTVLYSTYNRDKERVLSRCLSRTTSLTERSSSRPGLFEAKAEPPCEVGHASSCFSMVKQWVERKVRQHLMRARGRKGFGWQRWSSEWLYDRLGLFNDYQLRRWSAAKVAPAQ